jgi:hypothetical protein
MYEKTDFGAGAVAQSIYTIGSALAFGVVYEVSHNPPPMDLPVSPNDRGLGGRCHTHAGYGGKRKVL